MRSTSSRSGPPAFAQQLSAVERYLGRPLPERLLQLYSPGRAAGPSVLPLATGREHEPPRDGTPSERLADARERFESVLGHAMSNRELADKMPEEHVWPSGLLVVEDVGCGIVHAVDLDDSRLRVIEFEHFEASDDPDQAAVGQRLAYGEPLVPRAFQHRFSVVADSIDDWIGATPRDR